MKKSYRFLGALAVLAGSLTAQAAEIMFDGSVAVDVPELASDATKRPELTAFRDAKDCLTWYWIPPQFSNAKGNRTDHVISPLAIGNDQLGFVSEYDFTVQADRSSEEKMAELRRKIATAVNERKAQGLRFYDKCTAATETNVNLVALPSRDLSARVAADSEGERVGAFARIQKSNIDSSVPIYFNPANKFTFHLGIDATHPRVEPRKARQLTGEAPTKVGDVVLGTSVFAPLVEASLHVYGTQSAEWESKFEPTSCSTDQSGFQIGGGASGAFATVSAWLGFGSFSKHCPAPPFITQLKGCAGADDPNCDAAMRNELRFDYEITNRRFDGMIAKVCLDQRCTEIVEMPFKEWVRIQLLTQWLMSNFQFMVENGSKAVFKPIGHPDGLLKHQVDMKVSIYENVVVDAGFLVPVEVSKVRADDIDFEGLLYPQLVCSRQPQKYAEAERLFGKANPHGLIPIHPSCYAAQ